MYRAGEHESAVRCYLTAVGECELAPLLEVASLELNELALIFADNRRRGRSIFIVGCHVWLDLRRFGQSVQLDMLLEELQRAERTFEGSLIGLAGKADLFQTAILADIHVGHVNDDFLTDAILVVERIGVERNRQRSLIASLIKTAAIADDEVLVDISGRIGADHAPGDDKMFAGLVDTDFRHVGIIVAPIGLLELGYRDVGLQRGLRGDESRSIEVVLTGRESRQSHNGSHDNFIEMSHIG